MIFVQSIKWKSYLADGLAKPILSFYKISMNCEHCQELISVFLDNELDEQSSAKVREHLAVCDECSKVCEDLAMIIDFSHLDADETVIPPNPQALWCRINNIIERSSSRNRQGKQGKIEAAKEEAQTGWLPRRWNFSFMQIASAVLGIALISSVLTIIGIRNYSGANDDLSTTRNRRFSKKFWEKSV